MYEHKGSVPPRASCPGNNRSQPERKVPRRELVKLQEEMKQIWQSFLIYLAIYGVRRRHFDGLTRRRAVPGAGRLPLDNFFVWLARHTGGKKDRATETYRRMEQSNEVRPTAEEKAEPAEKISDAALALWIPALLFYGFGDVLTSALAFSVGAQEANPLARVFVTLPGGIWIFALVKTVIIVLLLFLAYYGLKKYYWIVPIILTIVGGYLVGHNVLAFIQAR